MKLSGEHLYRFDVLTLVLLPLSFLYWLLYTLHKSAYTTGILRCKHVSRPVIVVGNLTVGGTGKTPLVISLARFLASKGYHPGVIARGYGGHSTAWPQLVNADSDPAMVGDEPVLVATSTALPVCAGPDRFRSAKMLIDTLQCDVIISDDGLQHHRLSRDIEIVVIDGERRFGNGLLLPAGPLRERTNRLRQADFVVCRGGAARDGELIFNYSATGFINLKSGERASISKFSGIQIHAVAGIGNPGQFFAMLDALNANTIVHSFPDHHRFKPEDLRFGDDWPVVMTQKDAIKCRTWADDRMWYLEFSADLPEPLAQGILHRLEGR